MSHLLNMHVSSLVQASLLIAIQHHYRYYEYLGFSHRRLLERDETHLHNYEVRGLINSHICGSGG